MSFYEINLLVSTRLSEEEAIAVIAGIESKVEKYGKAISEKIIDKKKLAYPILKETEAWLVYFNFTPAEGMTNKKEVLDAVEKAIKAEKSVIRHLIIRKEELKIKRERPSAHKTEKADEAEKTAKETLTNLETEKVETEEPVKVETKKKVQFEELDELLDQE
ncbi:MAG: 30S ribosomal protein S6 [Candidatus Pacebacteria bacterium]|nr:30S ribosomal protein S6 [Candidatus Paceibacterota bacterium]